MNSSTLSIGLLVLVMITTMAAADPGPSFSALPVRLRQQIRDMVEPPPTHERNGCYSTPMYYGMFEGFEYNGALDKDPDKRFYQKGSPGPDFGTWRLDRNRLDWQEAMIRDWAELGLNNTHLNIYPVDGSLEITESYRVWLEGFVRLSRKYGLKIGVRLDALGAYEAWPMNPDNPDNVIDEYLAYATEIASLLKGQTAYYVLGDELTLHEPKPDLDVKKWTPDRYLRYFKRVCGAIKRIEPEAKVSMFAASSGEWFNILYLLKNGYADVGDGVAINHYSYQAAPKFFADAAALAPNLMFLSNGVGYVSTATAEPRFPQNDPYSRHGTEQSQATSIAKNMFAWWDLRADTAPYYITLRNWVIRGKVYPRWFGFFGIEDYVIDEHDRLTVHRHPGWYAYQTITHTFYNRDDFREAPFEITADPAPSMMRSYVHEVPGGSELVMMLWHDKPMKSTVKIAADRYRYAVRPDLFNYRKWTDVPYSLESDAVTMDLALDPNPTIIRLVATEASRP
ncbi:MAG: hypothetical protein CMJ18_05160 [Phycisphaeraceae bacterium]|nr:hypothetical protein [Phycisphaeraceae bacterium]